MKKLLSFILLILLIFTSCSQKMSKDTIEAAVSQEPVTLDVMKNSSRISRVIMTGNVFERVVTLSEEGAPVCELATGFYMSEDASSWTFDLRNGVKFHNGDIMDSTDAAVSLNRWIDNFGSAKKLVGDARFEVVDEDTITIKASHPILLLPDMMAGGSYSAVVMPKEVFESVDELGFLTEYIGTGPYCFDSWFKGQSIKLRKFTDYVPYGNPNEEMDGLSGYKHAYIENIVYNFVPDSMTRVIGVQSGQYHFDDDIVSNDLSSIEKNKDLVVTHSGEEGSLVLIFNKSEGVCSDVEIRKAINTALDLNELNAVRHGTTGYALHPNYMESAQAEWLVENLDSAYNQNDTAKAKELLNLAGYDGSTVRILTSNTSNMDKSAVALSEQLKGIGMNTELIITDWAGMMSLRNDPTGYDIFITAMTSVPLPSLKLFLDPSYAGWSDDETLQGYMTALNEATNKEEAISIWQDAQRYCYEYLPAIVAGHYLAGYLYRAELTGIEEEYGFYFYNSQFRN